MRRQLNTKPILISWLMPALVATWALVAAPSAFAVNERVSVSQNPDGTMVATLFGDNSACGFVFVGPPVVAPAGANFAVTSTVAGIGAPCPPGPVPLVPYSVNVDLGTVPDGTHTVTWSFVGLVMPSVSATFTMSGGLPVLPPTVPTLTPFGALALMLLLMLVTYPFLAGGWKLRKAGS